VFTTDADGNGSAYFTITGIRQDPTAWSSNST